MVNNTVTFKEDMSVFRGSVNPHTAAEVRENLKPPVVVLIGNGYEIVLHSSLADTLGDAGMKKMGVRRQ